VGFLRSKPISGYLKMESKTKAILLKTNMNFALYLHAI